MFHKATKLILVTENFVAAKVCKLILQAGAKGYTLVPAGGKGQHHFHAISSETTLIDAFANIKVEVVCLDRALAEQIATTVMEEYLHDFPGIIYLEEVAVVRPDRF